MRKMVKGETVLEIEEVLIARNGWEFFLTKAEGWNTNKRFGVVMGIETEMGDVYLHELRGYIIARSEGKQINELMPAQGWTWED